MRLTLLCLTLLLSARLLPAQDLLPAQHIPKNMLQVWLGGNGLAYSLNYERSWVRVPNLALSSEFGLAYYPPSSGISRFWFPCSVNVTLFTGGHHLETGIGMSFTSDSWSNSFNTAGGADFFATLRMGYRLQWPDGRFVFKAAFTPFIEMGGLLNGEGGFGGDASSGDPWGQVHPWGGIAFGYCF